MSSSVAQIFALAGRQFLYPQKSDDVEERLRIMRKYGVDMQVLSEVDSHDFRN
jgi:hypothetical protein